MSASISDMLQIDKAFGELQKSKETVDGEQVR
jgi:hypothetical protein